MKRKLFWAAIVIAVGGCQALFAHWYDPKHGLQQSVPVYAMCLFVLMQIVAAPTRKEASKHEDQEIQRR